MPSKSKNQQRLFQVALAVKKGEKDISDLPDSMRGKIKGILDDMSKSDIEDYANNLEEITEEQVKQIRKYVKVKIDQILESGLLIDNTNNNLREFAVNRGVNDPNKTEKLLKKIARKNRPVRVDGITIDSNLAKTAVDISNQLDISKTDFFSRPITVIMGIASKYVGRL